MRRWSLALLVTLASPALAQSPEPAQAPPTAPTAPAPEAINKAEDRTLSSTRMVEVGLALRPERQICSNSSRL